ncbi:hypothetical protein Cgig2_009441 [Carnegiea gigantea]|uniref:Uncharacterized protein n=1 Tax=Carnegiea gigantea TaxID=171969 RepID=A0A9Q1QD37_9CARY|nr:hypothetical protein Cgig2_009441 [Carnegiea gigantea]
MRTNVYKCTFRITSGQHRGYIIILKGIKVDPSKIKAHMPNQSGSIKAPHALTRPSPSNFSPKHPINWEGGNYDLPNKDILLWKCTSTVHLTTRVTWLAFASTTITRLVHPDFLQIIFSVTNNKRKPSELYKLNPSMRITCHFDELRFTYLLMEENPLADVVEKLSSMTTMVDKDPEMIITIDRSDQPANCLDVDEGNEETSPQYIDILNYPQKMGISSIKTYTKRTS